MNVQTRPTKFITEPRESRPKVAILDDFDGDPTGFPHGQAVESVLLSHSGLQDEDVQQLQNAPPPADLRQLLKSGDKTFGEAFRQMVVENTNSFFDSTEANLRTVLEDLPSVKVISQSQGETSARQLETLFDGLRNSPQFTAQVGKALGLGPSAGLTEVAQELLHQADLAIQDCDEARRRYELTSREVYQRGITYLVAAGNHGHLGQTLQSMGVESSSSAFRNVLVNEYVTVVAATDASGQPSTLNSPHSQAEVYELGEDLAWSAGEPFNQSGVHSGTSFAVPIVAGKVLSILEKEPELNPFEVEARLQNLDAYRLGMGETAVTANGHQLTADGMLEPYIQEQLGEGFVTDIFSEQAAQFANAKQERTLFGLPGQEEHEFQLVQVRPNTDGERELVLQTYFDEGHHVLKAVARDGAWDPDSVVEELFLNKKGGGT